ncbi:MAG TPA: peptidoglycan DD-metalloendopeptidase family protein [Desulfopila sp.]|nr:peptidoglycan DD-metalloendopeptidase family protein [Desulfopila sp.]
MRYPFMFYSSRIDHRPLFPGLAGDPFIADLSPGSPLLEDIDMRDQRGFQHRLEAAMGKEYSWGVAAYLENRRSLLGDCPQMVAENRFIHLGLDIIVALSTPLHAPLAAEVAESGYEVGEGNYGGFVLLRHESSFFQTFYSFYGHLRRSSLPAPGTTVDAGGVFAEIGDFHENGNWFYHTHLQVLTEEAFARGYISKGYCSGADLEQINDLCPSPIPLFRK